MTLLIIVCIIALLAFLLYKKFWKNKSDETALPEKEEEMPDYETEFFKRTENGEKSQVIVSLASQQDCALIRSLLHAEGIPSYVEGEHMNNIYGGITGSLTSLVAIKLYILCSDYDRAMEIIKDSKISDIKGYTFFDKEE